MKWTKWEKHIKYDDLDSTKKVPKHRLVKTKGTRTLNQLPDSLKQLVLAEIIRLCDSNRSTFREEFKDLNTQDYHIYYEEILSKVGEDNVSSLFEWSKSKNGHAFWERIAFFDLYCYYFDKGDPKNNKICKYINGIEECNR